MKLLDTTVLSNFVYVDRLELLASTLSDAITTPQVIAELRRGKAIGRLPPGNWQWLTVAALTVAELDHFAKVRLVLGDGEASCLAVASARQGTLFSDDRDARRYANRLGMPVSGTLGLLVLFIKNDHLTLDQANTLLREMIEAGYHSPLTSLADAYDLTNEVAQSNPSTLDLPGVGHRTVRFAIGGVSSKIQNLKS